MASSYYSQFQSSVQFNDNLTITSPSVTAGTVGSIVFTYSVTGTTTSNGLGSLGAAWNDLSGAAKNDITYFHGNQQYTVMAIPFYFGQKFWVDFVTGAGTYPNGATSGSADYSHTASVTAAAIFDANSNPVTNAKIVSALGVPYSASGAATIPEPGMLGCVALGLAVGAIWRRRRNIA